MPRVAHTVRRFRIIPSAPRATVLMAANLGEDADTTAAITGRLAGALYGLSAIPAGSTDRIARRDELVAVAERLLEDRG